MEGDLFSVDDTVAFTPTFGGLTAVTFATFVLRFSVGLTDCHIEGFAVHTLRTAITDKLSLAVL